MASLFWLMFMWLLGPVCYGFFFRFMHWIIMNYTDLLDWIGFDPYFLSLP